MARIKIEDLPPDENLTPEELEQIYGGAGRQSFRPRIESLEGREMYAANLASVVAPALHGPALTRQAPLVNEIQVAGLGSTAATQAREASHTAAASPALDTALAGFGGGGGVLHTTSHFQGAGGGLTGSAGLAVLIPDGVTPVNKNGAIVQVQWGAWETTATGYKRTGTGAGGLKYEEVVNSVGTDFTRTTTEERYTTKERWFTDGTDTRYTLELFDRSGARVVFGRQEGGVWKKGYYGYGYGGVKGGEEVYDKAPVLGGTLQSRDVTLFGVEEGERPHVLANWQNGKWVETTTNSAQFKTRTDVFVSPGGPLLSRDTKLTSGTTVHGELKGDCWVENDSLGTHKVYQRQGDRWKLTNFQRQTGEGWVEETWGEDGSYRKDVWKRGNHGAEGSDDHIYRIEMQVAGENDGVRKVTLYHVSGTYEAYGYNAARQIFSFGNSSAAYSESCTNATVTWEYELANNKWRLSEYHLVNGDSSANAWWRLHVTDQYGHHWFEQYGNDHGVTPPEAPNPILAQANYAGVFTDHPWGQ